MQSEITKDLINFQQKMQQVFDEEAKKLAEIYGSDMTIIFDIHTSSALNGRTKHVFNIGAKFN
jgi:hypothetical protein